MRTIGMGTEKEETAKTEENRLKRENRDLAEKVAELQKENRDLAEKVAELQEENTRAASMPMDSKNGK